MQSLMSNESKTKENKIELENYDELTDEQRQEIRELYKRLKKNSRWLPDSTLMTYFGKPPFHAYGSANVNGVQSHNTYLKTHNINPHAGGNKP